jgi:hypothetical protein
MFLHSQIVFTSPGIMLVIYQKATNHVPLKIVSIEDGTPLKTFTQLLHQNRKVDFIEQFNEKLLVKQDKENLQIIDVHCYYFCLLVAATSMPQFKS